MDRSIGKLPRFDRHEDGIDMRDGRRVVGRLNWLDGRVPLDTLETRIAQAGRDPFGQGCILQDGRLI